MKFLSSASLLALVSRPLSSSSFAFTTGTGIVNKHFALATVSSLSSSSTTSASAFTKTHRSFVKPTSFTAMSASASTSAGSKPFSVIVEAEIKEDRMEEFMKMIENNAKESRKEPGCIRFDVLRDQSSPTKFWFYEVYESTAAVDFHKTQPHYQAWADFKESGGTVSSVSHKADGEFIG